MCKCYKITDVPPLPEKQSPSHWQMEKQVDVFINQVKETNILDAKAFSRLIFPPCIKPSGDSESMPKQGHFDALCAAMSKKRVFISHSHTDYAAAARLKERMESCYDCFLDADVWLHVNIALRKLQTTFFNSARGKEETLNYWAAHMYQLLSNALMEEIKECDIFLFLEPSSSTNYIVDSPWLHTELQFADTIRTGVGMVNESCKENMPKVIYDLSEFVKDWPTLTYKKVLDEPRCTENITTYKELLKAVLN